MWRICCSMAFAAASPSRCSSASMIGRCSSKTSIRDRWFSMVEAPTKRVASRMVSLDSARRILGNTIAELAPVTASGIPIIGIEPSCTGVLRSDARELLGTEPAAAVSKATLTLAELLQCTEGWVPPVIDELKIVAQPHCHHHAVMGWSGDAQLLAEAGAEVNKLGGCCGLAGNFGVENGHYDVSVAVAEQQLLLAVRGASADTVVLADGYSCRTQLSDLSDRQGIHLAQLLDRYQS